MSGQGPTFASLPILRDGGVSIARLVCCFLLLLVVCLGDKALAQPAPPQPATSPELSAFQSRRRRSCAGAARERSPVQESLAGGRAGARRIRIGQHAVRAAPRAGPRRHHPDGAPGARQDGGRGGYFRRVHAAPNGIRLFPTGRWSMPPRAGSSPPAAIKRRGRGPPYYSEHGLNEQRAYQIVCIMVGSDAEKFGDLADETNLPEDRRHTCLGDYSNAVFSWNLLLEPHRRTADQPRTQIDVIYGPAENGTTFIRDMARSILLLETVAGPRGRPTRVAEAVDVGDGELRLSQRALGNPHPPGRPVLRAGRRVRRPLSRVRRRTLTKSAPCRCSADRGQHGGGDLRCRTVGIGRDGAHVDLTENVGVRALASSAARKGSRHPTAPAVMPSVCRVSPACRAPIPIPSARGAVGTVEPAAGT